MNRQLNAFSTGKDDIIRQHKKNRLRIMCLLMTSSYLWVGTSAGVVLNIGKSACWTLLFIIRTPLWPTNNAQQPAVNPGAVTRTYRTSSCSSGAGGQQDGNKKPAAPAKNEQNCGAEKSLSRFCWRRVRPNFPH